MVTFFSESSPSWGGLFEDADAFESSLVLYVTPINHWFTMLDLHGIISLV